MSETSVSREHERFAFLSENDYDRVSAHLNKNAEDLGVDDKTSYFFALPEVNLSVAVTPKKAIIKFKAGQLGKGIGFEELPEVELAAPDQAINAVRLFQVLTEHNPQLSEQIRRNYVLDGVELALKYTETWGFHLELERIYTADTEEELEKAAAQADEQINAVANVLDISLASDEELIEFAENYKKTAEPRGEYKAEEMRTLYSSLRKKAATGLLPEQQTMDSYTLRWIEANRPEDAHSDTPDTLELSESEQALLSTLSLPENWFKAPERRKSIHGQLHLARVAAFASHLARSQGRDDAEARSLFVAGLFHDISRSHDQDDGNHGVESAEWLLNNASEVTEFIGPVAKDVDIQLAARAIAAHDSSDETGYWANDVLKTADALDRYRLPKQKWWLNDEYLTLKPSESLKTTAFSTVLATEQAQLDSDDVTKATQQIIEDTDRSHATRS